MTVTPPTKRFNLISSPRPHPLKQPFSTLQDTCCSRQLHRTISWLFSHLGRNKQPQANLRCVHPREAVDPLRLEADLPRAGLGELEQLPAGPRRIWPSRTEKYHPGLIGSHRERRRLECSARVHQRGKSSCLRT